MAKTILKTSDKSNFILNMTEEQYAKLASFGLIAACFTTCLLTIIPEVSDTTTYTAATVGLAVSGVICMILALIALIKKYVSGSIILPAILFAAIVGWSTVSLYNSYDYNVGFYGFPQRGEGLLATIFYFCFFITAASIKRTKGLRTFLYAIISIGFLNAVVAVIQIFTKKLLYISYRDISVFIMAVTPDGLSQSPIFLAMLLTLSLTAALTVAASDENKKWRIFSAVSACLFAFVMVFTRTLMGVCGTSLGILAGFAAVFITKAPKLRLLQPAAALAAAAIGITIAGTTMSGQQDGYHLYDGQILWNDDAYQRVSASGSYNPDAVDIDDTYDVYTYLSEKTKRIIEKNKLYGTGPEQLVYPQIYTYSMLNENAAINDLTIVNKGTFDKTYNEYLYTAATRGIPTLILTVMLLALAVISGFRKLRRSRSEVSTAFFLMTVCGILIFFIGASNITYSPIFWACTGACFAKLAADKNTANNSEGAEKAEKSAPAKKNDTTEAKQ